MLKNRLLLLFSIALILLLIVPSAFGADNDTASLDSSSDNQMLASDIYFDSNATNDHGEGTADDPYKELRDGRILDDSVISRTANTNSTSSIPTLTFPSLARTPQKRSSEATEEHCLSTIALFWKMSPSAISTFSIRGT